MRIPAGRCQAETGADPRPVAAAVRRWPSFLASAMLAAAPMPGCTTGHTDTISGEPAVAGGDGLTGAAATDWLQLSDPTLGLSLAYPPDWTVDGLVIATQFSAGARCRSVRIVDFEPPANSGAAAPLEHSYVQVCEKPVAAGVSLDAYMRETYGESLAQRFVQMDLNGTRAYRSHGHDATWMIFARSTAGLVQIVAGVSSAPEQEAVRRWQVERILGELTLS